MNYMRRLCNWIIKKVKGLDYSDEPDNDNIKQLALQPVQLSPIHKFNVQADIKVIRQRVWCFLVNMPGETN